MPTKHIKLTPDQLTAFANWLEEKLEDVQERVDARATRWIRYRRLYEGRPLPKTFPWAGASNMFVPLVGSNVDAIHANMMNRLYGYGRLWDVEAYHPDVQIGVDQKTQQPLTWTDLAKSSQKFVEYYAGSSGPMDMYPVTSAGLLECIKLGTVVWYNPWVTTTQPDFAFDEKTGNYARGVERLVHDGPLPRSLPLEDFVILPGYSQIHGPLASPIVGHYEWFRKAEIRTASKNGAFVQDKATIEAVLAQPWSRATVADQVKDDQDINEGDANDTTYSHREDYRVFHGWIEYDYNDDGYEERFFVSFHRDTRKFLAIRPWIYKARPYSAARYITRENRFYGIGVPEALEYIQAGLNTVVNQTIDNGTAANVRAWKVRRGSYVAKTLGDIYPNKKVLVDTMDDIEPLQLGEIYPSSFEMARQLQTWGERRSGVNDWNLGRDADPKSPATSTMAMLQEATRRFDLYAKDIREALGEIGIQTLELIQLHRPEGQMYAVMGPEKGELVSRTLTLPTSVNIREHLKIVTTSSASSANKEVSKQNAIAAFGITTQYLEKLTNLGMAIANPQVSPPLKQLMYKVGETGERLMDRVLEAFDLNDVAAFMPQLGELYASSATQGAGGQPGAMGSPGGPAPGEAGGIPPDPGDIGGTTLGPGGTGEAPPGGRTPSPTGLPPGA